MADRALLKTIGILAAMWFSAHAAGLVYTLWELEDPVPRAGHHGPREVAAMVVMATTAPAGMLAAYLVPGTVTLAGRDISQVGRNTELVMFWATASVLGFVQWSLLVAAFLKVMRRLATDREAAGEP
jgi:hypothetical protein